MRSFVITIPEHEVSQTAADKCIKSFKLFHNWPIEKFNAITPKDNVQYMKEHNLRWNYPWQGEQIDIQSGLTKIPNNDCNASGPIVAIAPAEEPSTTGSSSSRKASNRNGNAALLPIRLSVLADALLTTTFS